MNAAGYAATVLAGVWSAFVPATPIEPYLVGLVATTDADPVLLGVAAGLGQAVGKLAIFLSARGVLRAERLRRWREAAVRRRAARAAASPGRLAGLRARLRPVGAAGRALVALVDRPALTAPIVLLSAVTGVPPLLMTTVYAARTAISAPVFGLACLVGRAARFVAIAVAPAVLW